MAIRFCHDASEEHIFNSAIGPSTSTLKYSCFMMDIVSASETPPTGYKVSDFFCTFFWPQPTECLQCDWLYIVLYLHTSERFLLGRSAFEHQTAVSYFGVVRGVCHYKMGPVFQKFILRYTLYKTAVNVYANSLGAWVTSKVL